MFTERLAVVIVAAVLLMLIGCRKEQSDNRLVEIAVKSEKQEAKVDQVARKVEEIEARLNEIQGSLREIGRPSTRAELAGSVERQVVDFRATPQYEKMAAALCAIQQQLNITQSELAETQEANEKRTLRITTLQNNNKEETAVDSLNLFAQNRTYM